MPGLSSLFRDPDRALDAGFPDAVAVERRVTSTLVSRILILFVISVPLVGWTLELGVAITASHLIGLVIVALATSAWLSRRPPIPWDLAVKSCVAFFLVATVTVIQVQLRPDIVMFGESAHLKSLKQIIGLGYGSAVFMALLCLLRWYHLGLRILRAHYWTTAVFAVLTVLQDFVALWNINSPLANFSVHNSTLGVIRGLSLAYGFPRVSLTMVEPGALAMYLLSGWAFWSDALDRPTFVPERARRLFVWSGVVLGVSLIVTGSRGAYVVFVFLVLGALAIRPGRVRRAGLVAVTVLVGLVMVGPWHGQHLLATFVPKLPPPSAKLHAPSAKFPATSPTVEAPGETAPSASAPLAVVERAAGTLDISVQQRTASYIVAAKVLRERPMLGTGFGTSMFYMSLYWPSAFFPLVGPTMLSHYATIATETGLLGLLCLAVFALAVMARLWRLAWSGANERVLAAGLAGSVGSYYLLSAGMALLVYQVLLIWLLLALALSVEWAPTGDVRPIDADPAVRIAARP